MFIRGCNPPSPRICRIFTLRIADFSQSKKLKMAVHCKDDNPILPVIVFIMIVTLCCSCSFVPLLPLSAFDSIFSPNISQVFQTGIPTEVIQNLLWDSVELVLCHAGYLSVCSNTRNGTIRKTSASASIFLGLLKVIGTFLAALQLLLHAGYPLWLSAFVTTTVLFLMGLFAWLAILPVASIVAKRKRIRDDTMYVSTSTCYVKILI